MWPGQLEALAVWADALQAEGEPLGELVALALRASELDRNGADHDSARQLGEQVKAARRNQLEALIGAPAAALPELEITWQLGVVWAISLRERPGLALDHAKLIEALAELVRRPAARFLDHLHLDYLALANEPAVLELLGVLTNPQTLARPRRVIIGRMPRRFRIIQPLRSGPLVSEWLAANPELTWLIRDGVNLSLPWTAGDRGSRLQQLERILAGPWSPAHVTTLGRALWDTSERVRRRLITAIPKLPDAAAPLISALLAMDVDRRSNFGDLLSRTLTRASTRPAWVAAIGQNFDRREPWVATWLATGSRLARPEAARAVPRMLELLDASDDDIYARSALGRAIQMLRGEP